MNCNECQYDLAEHRLYGCNAGAEDEAEKAMLFDVLAARVLSGAWHVGPGSIGHVLIDVMTTGERIHGATLEEAVTKAMDAEKTK